MKVKTDKISLGILALYAVYGIFAIPFVYFMLSLAVGLIVYSTSDSIEYTVVAVLLTGVLTVLISQARRPEGFVDGGAMISKRVESIRRPQAKAPIGVYASGFVEGFSDLSDNPVPTEKKPEAPTAAAPAAAPSAPSASTVAARLLLPRLLQHPLQARRLRPQVNRLLLQSLDSRMQIHPAQRASSSSAPFRRIRRVDFTLTREPLF